MICRDCLNPKFTKSFVIDYYFERNQPLKFMVYDIDSSSRRLEDNDFIGSAVST